MSKSSSQPQDKYVLRLPDGMRDRLKAKALLNGRSMNAEIVARLEESFDSTVFETAVSQHKTMIEKGKTLDTQSEALKVQAAAIEAQTATMEAWRADLKRMESVLATFAIIFDDAARGDSSGIEDMLKRAAKDPLRDHLRREAGED